MEIYSVNVLIKSEYGKIRTGKNSTFSTLFTQWSFSARSRLIKKLGTAKIRLKALTNFWVAKYICKTHPILYFGSEKEAIVRLNLNQKLNFKNFTVSKLCYVF